MKKVHTPENVAHLFANRIQSEATNSGRTLFFNQSTIYSYGSHFAIAKHTINKKGENALLFTTRGYSVTTSKHINIVHNATNHLNKIFCYNPNENHQVNLNQFEFEIKNILLNIKRATKPEKYILQAQQVQERAKKYADFFGLKINSINKLMKEATTGNYKEKLIKEAQKLERKKLIEIKKRQKEFSIQLLKWRNFEINKLPGREFEIDYLRYNTDKKRVETSQGIEIPLEIAKRAYKWVKNTVNCDSCDYSILNYKVKQLTKDFLQIGCHKIEIKEIDLLTSKW